MRISDYLRRIGDISHPSDATLEIFKRLHLAHCESFLFENVTIQTGGHISLALSDLERKFLDEGRGGYCFEQNTLFAAVLREHGFDPVTLLGRVRSGPPERWKRTHMVVRVPVNGELWLADVGFGAMTLLEPIALREGTQSTQGGVTYRLRREKCLWVLSASTASTTMDMYDFGEEPQTAWDVEIANHFTSTHPASLFRHTLTIQRATRAERIALRNTTLEWFRGGHRLEEIVPRAELRTVVRNVFGLDLPTQPFLFETEYACVVTQLRGIG